MRSVDTRCDLDTISNMSQKTTDNDPRLLAGLVYANDHMANTHPNSFGSKPLGTLLVIPAEEKRDER